MIEKLRINAIYDDFVKNVKLTDEQIKILSMLIKKEKITKISLEMGMSERTVKYEIKKIKQLFSKYCNLQLSKTIMLIE